MIDAIGYVSGLLLAISYLPQVVKTYRVKHADDVSMGMLLLLLAASIGYEIYAVLLKLPPVIVMNGIFVVLVATEIGLKLTYDARSNHSTG